MSSGTNQSTVQSDAELRVITVKTEAGDNVKYSGNPAELPGARYETTKAMRRAGAFTLLVEHNTSRLKNGAIAVDGVNNIPFVTGLCSTTQTSRATPSISHMPGHLKPNYNAVNIHRATQGEPGKTGIHGREQHSRHSRQGSSSNWPSL